MNRELLKDSEPIQVIVPDIVRQKMEAIVNLSMAVMELASALNSTNVRVQIQNCDIKTTGTGIQIGDNAHD